MEVLKRLSFINLSHIIEYNKCMNEVDRMGQLRSPTSQMT
jgi:hypothetical protein